MPKTKIAITLDRETLARIDHLVRTRAYRSRSRAIEEAVQEKLERQQRRRLAEECARLDPQAEKALAEEGMGAEWPEY